MLAARSQTARAISPSISGPRPLLGPLSATKPSHSSSEILKITAYITAKDPLTVERTIGLEREIWTGLSAPKTQKAGRQNGGDFGEMVMRDFYGHAQLNGSPSWYVYDFT